MSKACVDTGYGPRLAVQVASYPVSPDETCPVVVVGIENLPANAEHTPVDAKAAVLYASAIIDAAAKVDPTRPITDELLEWVLLREALRIGNLEEAGLFVAERLVPVAVGLRSKYPETGDG